MTAPVAEASAKDGALLQVRELDKHFGAVQALYHVDLDIPSGKVTARIDPLGRTTTLAYDAASNVTQVTDRDGRIRADSYDHADRLTQETAAFVAKVKGYRYG